MPDPKGWVIDTSTYSHVCRAGHADMLGALAPGGFILVPTYVETEIREGRDRYPGIPAIADLPWAQLVFLSDDEEWTMLEVLAHMGGSEGEHLGECAVIACAKHRGMVALLDERAAVTQAHQRGVMSRDTLWLVIEAYATLPDYGRDRAERVVDDLLETGMFLPISDGASLFAWAYEAGYLPHRSTAD